MDFAYIGQQIKRYRDRYELSLDDFSEKSGVSRSMLCQLEMAKTTPTLTVALKLAKAMEMGLGELVDPVDTAENFLIIKPQKHPDLVDGPYSEWNLTTKNTGGNIEIIRWSTTKAMARSMGLCRSRKRAFLMLETGQCRVGLSREGLGGQGDVEVSAGECLDVRLPGNGFECHFNKGSSGIWVHSY